MTSETTALTLMGVNQEGLTEEEKRELIHLYNEELQISQQGVELRPTRYKINKDTQTFTDPFGNATEDLRGVIVFKQKIRGLWEEGNNVPLCSSQDGVNGTTNDGEVKSCAGCPHNEWGSGKTGRGKACKEMRRIFVAQENGFLPIVVTAPPTSITDFDNYISARVSAGIPDIAQETVFRLVPEKSEEGFGYAKLVSKPGRKVPPAEMLRLRKMRDAIAAAAARTGVTAEDYNLDQDDVEGDDELI